MAKSELPDVLESFAKQYPHVWEAYNRLGIVSRSAGPLDERTQRLVKLAIAIGASREGAVNSHAQRALAAGCSSAELRHVGILAVTTIGWPAAFASICWMNRWIERGGKRKAGRRVGRTRGRAQQSRQRS